MSRDRQAHRDYQKHYRKRPHARFADYKQGARERGLAFELTIDEFVAMTEQPCHYCEVTPEETTIGVDRKDSKKGYTTNNDSARRARLATSQKRNLARGSILWSDPISVAAAIGRDYYEQFYRD